MKILAGITLFNPDLVRLKENLRAIAPQVDAVVCFDNGSRNSAEVREMIRSEEKAVLILAEGLARVDNRKYKKAPGSGTMNTCPHITYFMELPM